MPAKDHAPLGPEEFACGLLVRRPIKVGNLSPDGDLQVELRRERPAERGEPFVPDFPHLAGTSRKRHFVEIAIGVELEQPALLIERIVGPLEGDLPIIPAGLPAILSARNGLAVMRVAAET